MYYDINADTAFVEVEFDSITINVAEVLEVLSPTDSGETAISDFDYTQKSSVKIYQNGSNITLTNSDNFRRVSIYSISGKLLFNQYVSGAKNIKINASKLSRGSYILKLGGTTNLTKKITIK
jgi:hypothetical protein